MRGRKSDSNASSGGVTIQLHLVGVVIFSLALIVASALVTYGLTNFRNKSSDMNFPAGSNSRVTLDGIVETEMTNVPSWGQLSVRDIDLEQPDEYVGYETTTNRVERWTFAGMKPDAVRALMKSCGLLEQQITRALSPERMASDATGTVIVPDADLIFSLAPEVRSKLYVELGKLGSNQFMEFPFCFPGDSFDRWFSDGKVDAATMALLKKTVYPRGNAKCFSDLEIVLQQLPDELARTKLVKALSHQSALLMGIRVWPDTDIDKLIGYWTWPRGVRLMDVRPLLESLKRRPNGGYVSVVYFLPPFARQRLYTYPLPSQPGDPVMDCHWSTMNFFNETPDNHFSDPVYTANYIKTNYYQIAQPSAYGDIIFLLDNDGNAIHSAVYLADDIVFTKNGNNFAQPWMLMHLKNLLAEYTTDAAPRIAIYRNRNW
ncbi:MAG TPA: hypothetical protein VFV23_03260 [Verrucomicrobiae bacterium]|nr:hypothetical protein [Verrucomicrobiae bacterium]